MFSQVDICNLALTWLGANRISSFSDPQASDCAFLFDKVRVAELSKQFWAFASTRATLPALAAKPSWGYANQFELPVDCLTIIQINDYSNRYGAPLYQEKNDAAYMIEGRQILTNFAAPLKIRYVVDVKDPGLFHPLFARVMAAAIARDLCYRLKQDRAGVDDWYNSELSDARKQNAIIRAPVNMLESSYVMARL
jgi:hypothetical protein